MYAYPRMFDPVGAPTAEAAAVQLAGNLRRLMARQGWTAGDVARNTGLHERTVKSVLAGEAAKPHAKTLHKLAQGLGVSADELIASPLPARFSAETFDAATNPLIAEARAAEPRLFAGWCEEDFEELASRFGAGGELTLAGACQAAAELNHRREVQIKVAVILETAEAELLESLVETLYRRVVVTPANGEKLVTSRNG